MESATFNLASKDSKSARNPGIHVLRGSKIVGVIHLVFFYFAFILCHFLPINDRNFSNWLEVIALLVFMPFGVTTIFLLVGIAQRRSSFFVPFVVLCSISAFFLAAGTTVGTIATFIDWNNTGYPGLEVVAILAICTSLEGWSLAIVYRSYAHLNTTVESGNYKSELGAKIVGTVYLILTYLAFAFCFVFPVADRYTKDHTGDCFKLFALLVFVPIGAIIILLLMGIALRRASFLIPFFVVCSIFFILQVADTTMMTVGTIITIFEDWNKPQYRNDVSVALLVIPFMTIFACLSFWSLVVVYRSYRRLLGPKPEVVELRNLGYFKLEDPIITSSNLYPLL